MQALVPKSVSIARVPFCRPPQGISSFHSTSIALAKWKSKWEDCKAEKSGPKPSKAGKSGPKPSKTYMRYAVRQKRAEIKKALKEYLLYGKTSNPHFQAENSYGCADGACKRFKVDGTAYGFNDTSTSRNFRKAKSHSSSYQGKHNRGRNKSWQTRKSFFDEDYYEHPEMIYETFFGRFKDFTWSYEPGEDFHFGDSQKQFKWKDEYRWEKTQSRWSESDESRWSGSDDEDESTDVGSHAHRVTLGLPPNGPLKLDDVKSAFRLSAFKWHPDKHQGPSQAMATEKFKLCVDAYNSLCSVLKTA
ncbi:hypothetical protein Cni_G12244 [Canna indica]|uniref:J domain-containing protein n=1 Tax=Canna indica TaxID=4628 RepID=A0AAQ3QAD7_9LILI|nr:hypothetical protein Cni_G12244 [Canna indica]